MKTTDECFAGKDYKKTIKRRIHTGAGMVIISGNSRLEVEKKPARLFPLTLKIKWSTNASLAESTEKPATGKLNAFSQKTINQMREIYRNHMDTNGRLFSESKYDRGSKGLLNKNFQKA